MRIILIAVAVLAGFSVAAGSPAPLQPGIALLVWCAGLALLVQWLAFIPAYLFQTETFYDLCGSLTFIAVTLVALWMSARSDAHALLLAGMVLTWALRLGSFLFVRVIRDGGDKRFAKVKAQPIPFLSFWTLQALWVVMCAAPVLAALDNQSTQSLPLTAIAGCLLWLLGFVIETVADRQKRRFRAEHGRDGFIRSGLWSLSRHPNYAGEILLWTGITLSALPALSGWQHLTLITPVFVWLLLTRISGIPLLEAMADRRWGEDKAYQAYKQHTPLLWPSFRQQRGF